MIVEISNLAKIYQMGKVSVPALRGVSLSVTNGDFVAVAGPSGSGKTTLMNIIGLIDTPTEGSVLLLGQDVADADRNTRALFRHDYLGFIFQSFNLLPVLTVFENVELPLIIGKPTENKKERKAWVEYLLKEVGLLEWRKHKPSELSGGQRQRVAIARALAGKPKIVIADEPTANLDSKTGESILCLMRTINAAQKTTFIFSTHDPAIREMADHVIDLHDGVIVQEERREKSNG
jgi:putative ABC transport system ATP-binding protein